MAVFQNYGTVCYPVKVYHLLYMIHFILWAVVGTMQYVNKYTCHFHYIKNLIVPYVLYL